MLHHIELNSVVPVKRGHEPPRFGSSARIPWRNQGSGAAPQYTFYHPDRCRRDCPGL